MDILLLMKILSGIAFAAYMVITVIHFVSPSQRLLGRAMALALALESGAVFASSFFTILAFRITMGIVFFVSFIPVAIETYIEYRAEGPLFVLPSGLSGFCYRIFLIILFVLSFVLPIL